MTSRAVGCKGGFQIIWKLADDLELTLTPGDASGEPGNRALDVIVEGGRSQKVQIVISASSSTPSITASRWVGQGSN
jgi:hypothetical protein